jgi:DTW domain-containing protein YfiP
MLPKRVSSYHYSTAPTSRHRGFRRQSLSIPNSRHFATSSRGQSSEAEEDPNLFLHQVETTVEKVLGRLDTETDLLELPPSDREAVGVARHLQERLQNLRRNQDCPRCWMQQAHCICAQCPPVSSMIPGDKVGRIFLVVHHKEIGMKIDTAKLILAAFPTQCRLVVGGIGPDYQESMKELQQAIQGDQCLVFFPDETAKTFSEIKETTATTTAYKPWDVVVIDGTWAQARKLLTRYLPMDGDGPRRVQLSEQAVAVLEKGGGHQLRRHDIAWRQVGTFEATRLFLQDMLTKDDTKMPWEQLQSYQEIANQAARRELGPPRTREQ